MQVGHEPWSDLRERAQQFEIAVHGESRRHVQIEHEKRQGDGEDGIRKRCKSPHALSGDIGIVRGHMQAA